MLGSVTACCLPKMGHNEVTIGPFPECDMSRYESGKRQNRDTYAPSPS